MDRKGVVVNLPFDLLTGYARYVSRVGITSATRFSIDKVYREKVPRKVIGGALQAAAAAGAADSATGAAVVNGGGHGAFATGSAEMGASGVPTRDPWDPWASGSGGGVGIAASSGRGDGGGAAVDVSLAVQQQMAMKWGGAHPLMCTEAVYDVIRPDTLLPLAPSTGTSASTSTSSGGGGGERNVEIDRDRGDSGPRRVNSSPMFMPQHKPKASSSPRSSSSLFAVPRTSTPPSSASHSPGAQSQAAPSAGIDWEKRGFIESDVLLAAVEVVSGIDPTGALHYTFVLYYLLFCYF
jgi:hypothetical protein